MSCPLEHEPWQAQGEALSPTVLTGGLGGWVTAAHALLYATLALPLKKVLCALDNRSNRSQCIKCGRKTLIRVPSLNSKAPF